MVGQCTTIGHLPPAQGQLTLMILLSARDLTRQFDSEPVFAGLGLEIRAGDRVGLVGPNGSGKTDFNDNAITGYGADLQAESGTSKTLAAADNGTIIVCSSSSAVTITVPASLPTGFNCMIIQSGSGQVSLSASSTTLNNRNGSKTAGQYAILTLVHLGSNVFVVSGDTTS